MRKKGSVSIAGAIAIIVCTGARAGYIPGNLVVSRMGGNASSASAIFLDEFQTDGTPVGSALALPTVVNGSNKRCTNSGSALSNGYLKRSTNGQYVTLACYDADVATANVATTSAASVGRVVARVDAAMSIDTTTALNDAYEVNNFRSAITDGMNLWVGGTGNPNSTAGVRSTTLGATSSTQVNSGGGATNVRNVDIYSGQLYVSASSGTNVGINAVGSGMPTGGGSSLALLPGTGTSGSGTPSPYDFVFTSATTLYVADDRSVANGGGIQKWNFNGSTWSVVYTLTGTLTVGMRGLTATIDGSGNVTLFGITAAASPNQLIKVTDAGVASPFTVLATATAGQNFRGVALTPVPEPTTLVLLGLGGVLLFKRRR